MVTDNMKIMQEEQFRYLRMQLAQTTDPKRIKELKEQLDMIEEGISTSIEKQTLLAE
jgi:hypothetical protein